LNVVGLLNLQFAVRDGQVYILEANPRASSSIKKRGRIAAPAHPNHQKKSLSRKGD
jgi:hypothetical protein